jgi:hypothetical protein
VLVGILFGLQSNILISFLQLTLKLNFYTSLPVHVVLSHQFGYPIFPTPS